MDLPGLPSIVFVGRPSEIKKMIQPRPDLHFGQEEQLALNNVLRAILEPVPFEEALEQVLEEVLAVSWLGIEKKGGIFIVEGDPPALSLACSLNLSPPLLGLCARVEFGHCLCGRAARSQELVFSSCIDERHEIRFEGMAPHGHYSIPIVSHRETLGILVLYLPDGSKRSEREVHFLKAVSDALGGFILRERATRSLERSNRELEEARATAEKAARAKADFLATMSHEIRTPMNGILGTIDLLGSTKLDADQRELVEIARSSGSTLLVIINDILDFSKIEAGQIELESVPFDLRSLIAEVVSMLGPVAGEKGVHVEIDDGDGSLPGLSGDPVRIRQILVNLVGNAIKFSPEGRVVIRVRVDSREGGSNDIRIAVEDDGIGIAPENRERIFERFSQAEESTTRSFGGTGLGLAICQRLVELMGGRIGVESELGRGSTFWIELELPGAERPLGRTEADASPEGEALFEAHVLVVDDNQVNRLVARKMLERVGCTVETAADGGEALERVAKESFDLLLMDCQMPGVDGYEATRRIRALGGRFSTLPIIAFTANAQSEDRERCLEAGMSDVALKPLARERLREVLALWL